MNSVATEQAKGLDIQKIRAEFPMLSNTRKGKPLIYFDSASTNHKPQRVLDRLRKFYTQEYGKPNEANWISQQSTKQMEEARKKLAAFIGAKEPAEVVFSRGCTESINMVVGGFERGLLKEGDEVLITALEHHANIVPWQFACKHTGAKLIVAPINQAGELEVDKFTEAISSKTKIIAFSHSSNAVGTVLPVKQLAAIAHERNIPVLVDGAQYAPHAPVNMQELDCDFYTFSGHKMGMPSGVGVLYGKREWLEKLPPYEGGGDMAKEVDFASEPKLSDIPKKFEAGTMPFAEIIALSTLIDYLNDLDMHKTSVYEQDLLRYATSKLIEIDKVRIVGNAPEKEPVLSFVLEGMDVKELEQFLSEEYNIIVKAGRLTAQPLMKYLNVPALLRASFCFYNTYEEIDVFAEAVQRFVSGRNL